MKIDKEISQFCCNPESYGTICVRCGLCKKKVLEMSGEELMSSIKMSRLLK